MVKLEWFSNLKDMFKTEKPRTLMRVQGNKLVCLYLDSDFSLLKRFIVKFKNSSKLKHSFEKYAEKHFLQYDANTKTLWSSDILAPAKGGEVHWQKK